MAGARVTSGWVLAAAVLAGLCADHPAAAQVGLGRSYGRYLRARIVHQEIELALDPNVIVRTASLPAYTDDRGKPRRATAAELSALKGPDTTLPGYKAELLDLTAGKTVTVTLYRKKDAASADAPKSTGSARPDLTGWTRAGTLTGTILESKAADSLALRIDTAAVSGLTYTAGKKKTDRVSAPDHKVTMVMILSNDAPPAAPVKKN
jgi:hypothetical protein